MIREDQSQAEAVAALKAEKGYAYDSFDVDGDIKGQTLEVSRGVLISTSVTLVFRGTIDLESDTNMDPLNIQVWEGLGWYGNEVDATMPAAAPVKKLSGTYDFVVFGLNR